MYNSLQNNGIFNSQFTVIRRSLHILALLQHSNEEHWNKNTLADILSRVQGEEPLSSKQIDSCLSWLKKTGFDIDIQKGSNRISLSNEISQEDILDIIGLYFPLAIDTMGVRDCFKPYIGLKPAYSLWFIARIYFASLEHKKIKILYCPESGGEKNYILSPYHWIYRDSAVYLAAGNSAGKTRLYKLNRITHLSVTDDHFREDPPSADDILCCSMGAFISAEHYMITIEFDAGIRQRLAEDFGRLELTWGDSDREGFCTLTFSVCDLISVCRVVFGYGGRAVIVSPVEACAEMKRLLEGNAKGYS